MKKLSLYVFLVLLVCNNSFAKEIKISHKDENSISITFSLWTEANMREMAADHCGKYQKSAFTFGLINKQGVPDDKGKATRLYHCSKKFLNNDPLTGKDNLDWTNHDSNSQVTEKTKKKKKVVKKEKTKKQKEIVKTEVKSRGVKVKLICQGMLEKIEGYNFYISFDDKTIDVLQGGYGNKLTFKVKQNDDYWVISHLRSLLKGDTGYDTHVTDWNGWDSVEGKKHLYQVQIDRIEGMAIIMRSKKPYKEGKTNYKLVPLGEWGMECKKSGLSGKF